MKNHRAEENSSVKPVRTMLVKDMPTLCEECQSYGTITVFVLRCGSLTINVTPYINTTLKHYVSWHYYNTISV